jgi:AraC-like DNA-binding protein
MFPNRKSFLRRLPFCTRIAAIFFLFAVLPSAAAVRDTGHKKAVKPKAAATAVSARNPVKSVPMPARPPSPKQDTAAAARDSTRLAMAADSTKKTVSQKRIDSATVRAVSASADSAAVKAAASVRDTVRKVPAGSTDTGIALSNAAGTTGDKTKALTKQNNLGRSPAPASKVARPGKTFFFRLLALLFAVAAAGAAVAAIAMAVRNRRDKRRFLTTTRLSVMDKEVQRACRYIELHYAQPGLTAKSVCEALVTGEAFLGVLMERNLGMGLGDFITHVRVNGAKAILNREPAVPAESVAKATGFADVDTFDTVFTKVTGVSFGAYTRQDGR